MPTAPEPVTPASILALVQSIERHDPGAPASAAFRSALRRKGVEADAAGGLRALDELMDAVAEADPDRADARTAILRAAWAGLMEKVRRRGEAIRPPAYFTCRRTALANAPPLLP